MKFAEKELKNKEIWQNNTKDSIAVALNLPFKEQERFFQKKLNIPTLKWNDLWKEQHIKGFMVAGAYKAELLADFRNAVDKAIKDGTTLEEFRDDFDDMVAKFGWNYNGSRNWRSEIIYSTNIRTSYAAGRWEQLTDPEQLEVMPYLMYKHGDSRVPRPEHLAWDGLTLPADDPWWDTHYPPNGFGCRCRVFGATRNEYLKAQQTGKPIRPAGGPTAGVDPGWDYNVGKTSKRDEQINDTINQLPHDIAAKLKAEIAGYKI